MVVLLNLAWRTENKWELQLHPRPLLWISLVPRTHQNLLPLPQVSLDLFLGHPPRDSGRTRITLESWGLQETRILGANTAMPKQEIQITCTRRTGEKAEEEQARKGILFIRTKQQSLATSAHQFIMVVKKFILLLPRALILSIRSGKMEVRMIRMETTQLQEGTGGRDLCITNDVNCVEKPRVVDLQNWERNLLAICTACVP